VKGIYRPARKPQIPIQAKPEKVVGIFTLTNYEKHSCERSPFGKKDES